MDQVMQAYAPRNAMGSMLCQWERLQEHFGTTLLKYIFPPSLVLLTKKKL